MCVIAPDNGESLLGMTALMSFKKRLIVDIANDSVELLATAFAQIKQPMAASPDRRFSLPPVAGKKISIKPPTQV
jgi:hypothetical protein